MNTKESTSAAESHSLWRAVCGPSTPADARNNRRLALAALVWVSAFLASLILMERYGDDSLVVSSVALVAAAAAGGAGRYSVPAVPAADR